MGLAFGVVRLFKLIGGTCDPASGWRDGGWAVLAWGLGAAVLAAVLAGHFSRAARLSAGSDGGAQERRAQRAAPGRGERRLLRGVTMAQTALTLALLVGAGLLIRTMIKLRKSHRATTPDTS